MSRPGRLPFPLFTLGQVEAGGQDFSRNRLHLHAFSHIQPQWRPGVCPVLDSAVISAMFLQELWFAALPPGGLYET